MAIITLYTRDEESEQLNDEVIVHSGSVLSWILDNIREGENFKIYEGGLAEENEISRDEVRVVAAEKVSVFLAPAGSTLVPLLISLVVSVAVTILSRKDLPGNVNRNQQSPNNSLTDRRNIPRPNQRIVDVIGRAKSVPDVIQREYARYVDNIEVRYGYYCICRNKVQVEDVRDGDSLIETTPGAAAGIYYPGNSPNNSAPDVQIGDLIDQEVVGVYQSNDAIGQSLKADDAQLILSYDIRAYNAGYLELAGFGFDQTFSAGDAVEFRNVKVEGAPDPDTIGSQTSKVLAVTSDRITFDISLDASWSGIIDGGTLYTLTKPTLLRRNIYVVGPFVAGTTKINSLLVNVYAPNGMYKDGGETLDVAIVDFNLTYQKLDDSLLPVGPETIVTGSVTGVDRDEKGTTMEVDLGAPTFVRYSLSRTTKTDKDFSGNVVDDIKLKDVFGLFDIDKTDFGNVTTIQTKRTSTAQTTATKEPEVNCIATELVNKYEGGAFAAALTPNTQGMQSLIRLALDPYIGRRESSELDIENLIESQSDCEAYFNDVEAGRCSYSLDSTNISAQEIFFLISNAMFCAIWREGRVLKSWFERPQTVPQMVFTHRSKRPNSETWLREFAQAKRKDSIEFTYTDDLLFTQETLYYPVDRSGRNPLKVEIPGIMGLSQATWRMMREYNKLLYQSVSVDFTATEEGRLVLPQRLISVVKGALVGSYDGYIVAVSGLSVELSQDVVFTAGDDHFIILKRRDGTAESIPVTSTTSPRIVELAFVPTESIYTGNDELKTEFSFGNESRLSGQLMLPQEISPESKQYVGIRAINYDSKYYQDDPVQAVSGGFSSGFSDGFR